MVLQRKNHGLTPGGVGGHDRIRHHIRRDREWLVVNKLAVNGGSRGEDINQPRARRGSRRMWRWRQGARFS
jgi:hypothetical protein